MGGSLSTLKCKDASRCIQTQDLPTARRQLLLPHYHALNTLKILHMQAICRLSLTIIFDWMLIEHYALSIFIQSKWIVKKNMQMFCINKKKWMIELIVNILPHVLPFSTLPFIIIHHFHIKITDICGNEWTCEWISRHYCSCMIFFFHTNYYLFTWNMTQMVAHNANEWRVWLLSKPKHCNEFYYPHHVHIWDISYQITA